MEKDPLWPGHNSVVKAITNLAKGLGSIAGPVEIFLFYPLKHKKQFMLIVTQTSKKQKTVDIYESSLWNYNLLTFTAIRVSMLELKYQKQLKYS